MTRYNLITKFNTFSGRTFLMQSDEPMPRQLAEEAREKFYLFIQKAKTEKACGAIGSDDFRIDIQRIESVEVVLVEVEE